MAHRYPAPMTTASPSTSASCAQRLENIQALRGIAALMVVFSHLFHIDRKYSGDPILSETFLFGMAGVDLFFVISGFIMVYVTRHWTGGSFRRLPEFLFARITRIYPLYWIISLIVLIIYLIRPDAVFSASPGTPDIFKSFLLWPDNVFPLLEVGWTLVHEMNFYLIFALILILPIALRPWALCLWAGLVMLGYSSGFARLTPELAILLSPLSLEFIIGGLIAYWLYHAGAVKLPPLLLIVFAGLLFMITVAGVPEFPQNHLKRALIFALPAALIVGACVIRDKTRRRCPRFMIALGDWSYALYLSHILVLSLGGRLWAFVRLDGPVDNIIALMIMTWLCVGTSALIYLYIETPIIKASRHLREKTFA